ncbi:MAG: polyprenyl synthetase family protein [Flavobacteriales bacterium]
MNHPMLLRLRQVFDAGLSDFLKDYPENDVAGIYNPIHYLLALGGKRLRPVVALAAAEAESENALSALPVAMAVELFHNFTLMHDDIMDAAPLRRGKQTVHLKWDENAAILSGDTMYTLANMALAKTRNAQYSAVANWFHRTALEVCLGQQLDMSFENRNDVTLEEYTEMIRLKTSVLLAASMAMGAAAAGADEERQNVWYRFGEQVGLAFQIQDDLLDTFGGDVVGKQIGGDILADKKTHLWIHTLAAGGEEVLRRWEGPTSNPDEKIESIRNAMLAARADEVARAAMRGHVEAASAELEKMNLNADHDAFFRGIALHVVERVS